VNKAFEGDVSCSPEIIFTGGGVACEQKSLVSFKDNFGMTELSTEGGHSEVEIRRVDPVAVDAMRKLDLRILPELELARDRKVVPLGPNTEENAVPTF